MFAFGHMKLRKIVSQLKKNNSHYTKFKNVVQYQVHLMISDIQKIRRVQV